jgi:hypothetical protein
MISTTSIPTSGSSISKVIEPGNVTCKITKVTLDPVPYKAGALNINLHVETEPIGGDFEGFLIDKDTPDLGRYQGQIGRIRMAEYPFADGLTKTNIEIKRDTEMLKRLDLLCKELNCSDWLQAQDNKHETIESLFEQFNIDKPYADKYLYMCVGGKEYLNKEGYVNYDLFLPKAVKGKYAFKNVDDKTHVMEFEKVEHIKRIPSKVTVAEFGTPVTKATHDDLDI